MYATSWPLIFKSIYNYLNSLISIDAWPCILTEVGSPSDFPASLGNHYRC